LIVIISFIKGIVGTTLLTLVPFFITLFIYASFKNKKIKELSSKEQTRIGYSLLAIAFILSLPNGLDFANEFIDRYLANSQELNWFGKVFNGFGTILVVLFGLTTMGILTTGIQILNWLCIF
jgi:hypothetical protein